MNLVQQKFLIEAQLKLQEMAAAASLNIGITVKDGGFFLKFEQSEREAQQLFELYANKFGYSPDLFGQTFKQNGTAYKVTGVKPTAEKNCLIIRRVKDDKEFVCSPSFVGELV